MRNAQNRADEDKQDTQIEDNLPREFHNPYNFVPAVPRQNETLGELGDHEPSGHDRFHAELLSGKLCVKMTVETPLLLPDTAKVEVQETDSNYAKKGHKTFPVRVRLEKDKDGKTIEVPDFNPTAIKGMLRSAYEAITNSRLSIFHSHDERLAFRGDARGGIYVVPARIERRGTEQHIVLCPGSSIIGTGGAPELLNPDNETRGDGARDPMYAAWLRRGARVDKKLRVHGMKVWAYITRWRHQNPDFLFWSVAEARPYSVNSPTDTNIEDGRREDNKYRKYNAANHIGEWVAGYVCLTMYKNEPNIKRRHDERIFFDKYQDQQTISEVVTEDHRAAWRELIVNYRQSHDNGKGGLEPAPSEPIQLEWSRHIHNAEAEKWLPDNMLCYARVERDTRLGWRVLELLPVMIARRLYEEPPGNLLPSTLKPAATMDKLSPADRVFGWVGQNVKGKNAYRGQIRIGAVDCISNKAEAIEPFTQNIPLQILGQPKPQQGRFYVAEKQSGEAQIKKRSNENAGYKKDRGLRGRKVYPHHNLPDGYWDNPNQQWEKPLLEKYFQEFRRPNGNDQRDKQNRSVKGWVKPETVFKFDIHFINLSQVELGALIWLLSMNKENENLYFHRFGGGKPLGFGSVKLSVESSDIRKGASWKEFYQSLDDRENGRLNESEVLELGSDFKTLIESTYPTVFNSFLCACKGFSTNLPIHYPRARRYEEIKRRNAEGNGYHTDRIEYLNPTDTSLPPHVDGLAYEWFVENSKGKIQTFGEEDVYPRFALKDIVEDDGLPIFLHKSGERKED
jgi:CRISPR-associated protein (TIGR03986 family)